MRTGAMIYNLQRIAAVLATTAAAVLAGTAAWWLIIHG